METNYMAIQFAAKSANESLSRMVIASFMAQMDPTLEEIMDVKTAVSEAVTNAIVHGYEGRSDGIVEMECKVEKERLYIEIRDCGVGIGNVKEAMQPFYTTKKDAERSGMGFAFMEAFMDELTVESAPGKGTTVCLTKIMKRNS